MVQRVYIVRGPSPDNYGFDTDGDGIIFGVYANRKLAERELREAMTEYDFDYTDCENEYDRSYVRREFGPWIDERVVQGSTSSANFKMKSAESKKRTKITKRWHR